MVVAVVIPVVMVVIAVVDVVLSVGHAAVQLHVQLETRRHCLG